MMRSCVSPPIGCGREIPEDKFQRWDSLSQREFKMSQWCLGCQGEVFGDYPWDDGEGDD